ncbi:MAG TPA: Ig-like domain-containing protein, partial [Longimicrobium sp.]
PAAPASIVPLNGDTMVAGAAGSLVEDSIAVVVRDAYGNRVPGATVSWATTAGGGTFRQATTTSDTGGVARGEWVLGPAEFRQMAQASIPGAAPVRFTSWAATAIRALSGSGETARAGFTLAVSALLANGDAGVPDVPVRWQVTSGGGSVTPALSRSGGFPQNGVATAQWTLGPALGTQTLTATVGALQATFTATVVTGGSRVLVAQVPGRVYDADGTRLLWRDDRGAPAVLKVRTLASGADQVVNGPAGWRPAQGRLVPGGAVVVDSAAEGLGLHEWLDGTHVALGPVRDWDVDGEWLAWSTRTRVLRRTLATRTTRVLAEVSDFSFSSVDVDANGHVAWTDLGRLWLFRGTSNELVTTRVAPSGRGNVLPPVIDGPNVVYGISDPASDWTGIALLHAGGHEFLMPPVNYITPGTPIVSRGAHYDARGGWVAFVRFLDITGTRAPVYRRSPAGDLQRLSAEDTRGQVDALGADGSVVFRVGSRRFVSGGGTMFDVGAVALGERVVWRGGRFYLLADGNVYELAP